jgi:hypothetical protein
MSEFERAREAFRQRWGFDPAPYIEQVIREGAFDMEGGTGDERAFVREVLEESGQSEVDGCCCGDRHLMATLAFTAYQRTTAGLDPLVTVDAPGGRWRVPRLYIACHGLRPVDVPMLALVHGWERAGYAPDV